MWLILVTAAVVVAPVALYAAAWRNMAACYDPAGPVPGPEIRRPGRRVRAAASVPAGEHDDAGALLAG